MHWTESVPVASTFDVSSEALPKLRGVADNWQFARTVATQGDEPALTTFPGLAEQFGLTRRYPAPAMAGEVVLQVYVPGTAVVLNAASPLEGPNFQEMRDRRNNLQMRRAGKWRELN